MTAAMNANLSDPRVTNGIKALREAMNGKAPPGYRAAAEKSDAVDKARMRRAGKQKRKG